MLTDSQKRIFVRDGFIFLQNAVPQHLIAAALSRADQFYQQGAYHVDNGPDPVPRFNNEATNHPDIGCLLRGSPFLEAAIESLLGPGNSHHSDSAQIAFRPFDTINADKGMTISDPMPRLGYHIDGGMGPYRKNATPFTALVGVCLSTGQDVDENRGQLTVWPGSHHNLHPVVTQRWRDGLIDQFNVFGGHQFKPDLGEPIRVLMRPGDAVIAHQRLGHSGGINLSNMIRKNLYFRIFHKRHDQMIEKVLTESLFAEFEGVHHLL